jgi:pimeloyl-ACP methyl ester carboxylesterase
LDLLLARPEVAPKRVAYVGHSYGAQWGAILAAVDRRFKAAILIAGTPTLQDVLEGPGTTEFRKRLKPGQLEKYLEVNRPLNAINFIALAAPMPLFFQFATFEQNFSHAAMERFYQAAREPKSMAWYDAGHDLNDPKTIADRDRWLDARLSIPTIRPFLEAELGSAPK